MLRASCGDALVRIRHRQEPGSVEALLSEPAVERLDECVVRGRSPTPFSRREQKYADVEPERIRRLSGQY